MDQFLHPHSRWSLDYNNTNNNQAPSSKLVHQIFGKKIKHLASVLWPVENYRICVLNIWLIPRCYKKQKNEIGEREKKKKFVVDFATSLTLDRIFCDFDLCTLKWNTFGSWSWSCFKIPKSLYFHLWRQTSESGNFWS